MKDIIQQYKDYVWGKQANDNTRELYCMAPKQMLDRIGKPFEDITTDDIDTYVQRCYKRYKHNTNHINFSAIRYFLQWAKRLDLEERIPRLAPKETNKHVLNTEDTEILLETVTKLQPRHRLIFYLEYDTIRRPNEIRLLKKTDRYDDILRYHGKTGIKKAVMTDRLVQVWDDYLNVRPYPATPQDDEYLLLNEYSKFRGKHLGSKWFILKTIREIFLYSGIEIPEGEKPTNYLIKRTSITQQLHDGAPIKYVQFQAGHEKPETTMRYQKFNIDSIWDYVNTFEHKKKKTKAIDETCFHNSFI